MSRADDWLLAIEEAGHTRRFGADDLPVSIGSGEADDIRLAGVDGSLQIGWLDGVFFVLPSRTAQNARIGGEPLRGSAKLGDGDVVALDHARLHCRIGGGRLSLSIEAQITAGDTAPPDLDELARADAAAGEISIQPISFRTDDAGARERRRWPRPATVAVTLAFAVLAVLGWFAFTARSVDIVVEPAPASLELPETLFHVRIGRRHLLRSGSHRVTAELDGYYPLDASFTVGRSADQTVSFELTRLPGLVSLATEPEPEAGAEVRLDGELLGTTPLSDVEIRPGVRRFEFAAERFLPEVAELDVEGGHVRQTLTATLTPNWAPVSVTSRPSGANVYVDGERAGATPVELELEAGRRALELRLDGYNAWRDELVVNADEPRVLPPVELTEADGRIELVTDPPEAAVSLNGEFQGRTPLTLRLRPGRAHELVLSRPGYATVTRELSVAADSGRRLELALEPQFGQVRVATAPAGAAIFVDGEPAGTTPDELSLTAVAHDIEVRLDGYAERAETLTPRPGFPQSLSFELEPLDDVTGGGYPRRIETSLGQTLVLVPAGEFTMGSSRREQGRRSNEVLRLVELSRAFYIGVHEVTNAEFREFRAGHDSGSFRELSLDADDQPVVRVAWADVAQYLNWLSIRDRLQPVYEESAGEWRPVRPLRNGYRLPTEAEWAWAARAAGYDEAITFPWNGPLPPPDRSGNYADIAASDILPTTLVTYNDGYAVSAPPGSFPENASGLADIGGNVAEWVQDYYDVGVVPSGDPVVDPLGPLNGRFHVVRGSTWRSATVTQLRLAYRDYSAEPREDLGFRIARNLD